MNEDTVVNFPEGKKPTPMPGERLHSVLLELVRMCVLDKIGRTSICMEDVVIDGHNTGTWILDLRKGGLAPSPLFTMSSLDAAKPAPQRKR